METPDAIPSPYRHLVARLHVADDQGWQQLHRCGSWSRAKCLVGDGAIVDAAVMLQIASGMYFRDVTLYETLHRATIYTNAQRSTADPIELPIGRLAFTTWMSHVIPVTVEVTDRLEAVRPDGTDDFMLATTGRDLVDDVAAVVAFALNVTCTSDVDLARRLVAPEPPRVNAQAPTTILRRTFDPRVVVGEDELDELRQFCDRLLALRRDQFEAAMRAIRGVGAATTLIADDAGLAYTLFVAAVEALSSTSPPATAVTWEEYDGRKRKTIDSALDGVDADAAERIRAAVLDVDALALRSRFRAFVLDHIEPSFFRDEAVGALRPISAPDLSHALDFAYGVRSRTVHALERLAPELWVVADRADTLRFEGRTVLGLEGLNRLCRHVIRRFVERAPTGVDPDFDYRSALPGIVRVEFAPQYWIGAVEGLGIAHGPRVFDGFLDVVVGALRGIGEGYVDMRPVLAEVERMLPGEAKLEKRLPWVALYVLWHRLTPTDLHRPDPERLVKRFSSDLSTPTVTSYVVHLFTGRPMPWSTAELVALSERRDQELRKGRGQPLPRLFDAAFKLSLAERLRNDGLVDAARSAVAAAVELVPGEGLLMDYESRVQVEVPPMFEPVDFVLGRGFWNTGDNDSDSPSTGGEAAPEG